MNSKAREDAGTQLLLSRRCGQSLPHSWGHICPHSCHLEHNDDQMPGDSSLPGLNALSWAYSPHTFSLDVSETPQANFTTKHPGTEPDLQPRAMPVCSSHLGPSRPGPFMWVPEPWQASQSSIYSQGWVQSFGLLNSIFVCPHRPRFIHSAVGSDSEGWEVSTCMQPVSEII